MRVSQSFLPTILILGLVSTMLYSSSASANYVPYGDSQFYYQLGGGQDIPLPAYYDTTTIPLDVQGDAGLGFDCGSFNPIQSLSNSLNEIKSSFQAVKGQVIESAKGAVTEFPLYELSRADPSLYNILTNAIAEARDDINISTKSCEVMQNQIASGQDPYAHWATISMGNTWRKEIGTAQLSGDGDINQAKSKVDHDAGQSGVTWVDPDKAPTQTQQAGGKGQPPIHVIHDTAMTGYQVVLQNTGLDNHGSHDDTDNKRENSNGNAADSALQSIWPKSQQAADWLTNVVGDQTITTYNKGLKQSKPGVGLYPDIANETHTLIPLLQALVDGQSELNITNLQAVSPPGVSISAGMMKSIRAQSQVMQDITIQLLAQNVAALRVIEKARLAGRILQAGSRVPAVYSNKAAQTNIHQALDHLHQAVTNMMFYVNAKKTLAANMMSTIVNNGKNQTANNTKISSGTPNVTPVEHGAVESSTPNTPTGENS